MSVPKTVRSPPLATSPAASTDVPAIVSGPSEKSVPATPTSVPTTLAAPPLVTAPPTVTAPRLSRLRPPSSDASVPSIRTPRPASVPTSRIDRAYMPPNAATSSPMAGRAASAVPVMVTPPSAFTAASPAPNAPSTRSA